MPTVIIVDDHEGFRLSAKRLLETEGYVVVGEAADGASALEGARELTPDVMVVDVHLPDTDGFALAAELAQLVPQPRIVLVSSHDASDFGPLVDRSPAVGFVSKGELSGETLGGLLDEIGEPA
ncbi:MAG: response regulator [Gaiellaceae bacterium]